jgi:hypothetical protein
MIDSSTLARGFMRALFSAIVAALFLLVLLVASAQQQVMNNLEPGTSYSVARKVVADADLARRTLSAEQDLHEQLTAAKRDREEQVNELEGHLYTSMATVDRITAAIAQSKLCPSLRIDGATEGLARWSAVYGCYSSGTVPADTIDDLKTLTDPANDPTKLASRITGAKFDLQSAVMQLATTDARIEADRQTIEQAAKASNALQIVVLLDHSFIGAFGLTWIPPALMQILLCFLSGLFGALLITLVLLVYPNNELSFARSNSFWNRILLGGLIAVGVFVMIAGGVAVLGSSEAILNGQNNFLSFCAIGMLAGGFSDRFAKWLSDNATMMVKSAQAPALPPPTEPVPAPE